MRARRILASIAFTAVFLGTAAVSVRRAAALAASGPPLDAVGERRFMRWANRDAALAGRLEDAGRTLEPGQAVLAVCAPSCDTSWFWAMAAYGLSRQAVVDAKTEGELGRVFPTRVVRTAGAVRLLPRSDAGRGDGAR